MATQIHAFGPNGELSPGAEAALEGLGGGGGGATALGDLTDVDTTGATTGQVLTFDGSEWSPDAPSAGTVTSTSISDSTATGRAVLTAADAATARGAIGAGTSNLVIGTTAGTAAEGNRAASTTAIGMVELATNTEATTGTDTTRAVTPAGVKAVVDALSIPDSPDDIGAAPATQTINAKTGAYTLVASDAGKLVTLTLAAPADLTVPANVFTAGQRVDIADRGTARVTVVAGSGMTVNPPAGGSLVMEGQYAYASLVFVSATEADLVGLVAAP